MQGIINIYKEKGWTSHDVVAYLRKKLKIKKVGHTGTLDPEAEGVLPVCIGKATKAAQYITDTTKAYSAELTLGIITDTQDHTGQVIGTREVNYEEQTLKAAIQSFVGTYDQIPPMYSALKVNGKKLYQLAREGKEIERKPRKVIFYDIQILTIKGHTIEIAVECSKGTYIRTLCADIGDKLGCGAHMSGLIRTRSGSFNINQSLRLSEVDHHITENTLERVVVPIDQLFENLQTLIIDPKYNRLLYNGNPLKLEDDWNQVVYVDNLYRVYDEHRRFIGLYQAVSVIEKIVLKPVKIFL